MADELLALVDGVNGVFVRLEFIAFEEQ